MPGETTLDIQPYYTGIEHYDLQISFLDKQIERKKWGLSKFDEAEKCIASVEIKIAHNRQELLKQVKHQEETHKPKFKEFAKEQIDIAETFKALSQYDIKFIDLLQDECFTTAFNIYLNEVKIINNYIDAHPNFDENRAILDASRINLEKIISDFSHLRDIETNKNKAAFLDSLLNQTQALHSYAAQFFENNVRIEGMRTMINNDDGQVSGLKIKLGESRLLLKQEASELVNKVKGIYLEAQIKLAQEEKENHPSEKKSRPSSSATSSITLPLAQRSLNIPHDNDSQDLKTETKETLKNLENQLKKSNRIKATYAP